MSVFGRSFKVDTTKPYLTEKGYWFYYSNKEESRNNGVAIPLNKKAVWLNVFSSIWGTALFIFLAFKFFTTTVESILQEYGLIILGINVIVAIPIIGIYIIKGYDPRFKEYKAVNRGKRDGMYTSDQNLFTTTHDGLYLCLICATPIATTDDRTSVSKPVVSVSKLMDDADVTITGEKIVCNVCQTELGIKTPYGHDLNGDKLALDSGELHYIYPDNPGV